MPLLNFPMPNLLVSLPYKLSPGLSQIFLVSQHTIMQRQEPLLHFHPDDFTTVDASSQNSFCIFHLALQNSLLYSESDHSLSN